MTHSFISAVCLAKINVSCEQTSTILEIHMPSRGIIDTNKIDKAIQIDFDGRVHKADLHVIELKDLTLFWVWTG